MKVYLNDVEKYVDPWLLCDILRGLKALCDRSSKTAVTWGDCWIVDVARIFKILDTIKKNTYLWGTYILTLYLNALQ